MITVTPKRIEEIIQQGESIEVEFKASAFELNKNVFETVCAFLNRKGGHLLPGVADNGHIEGVLEECVPDMVSNLISQANNPQKLYPPFYLSPQVFDIDHKKVIYLYVPESSLVHNTGGRIYDRNSDGDLDISRHSDQVTQLYLKKQSVYTENKVFPFIELMISMLISLNGFGYWPNLKEKGIHGH